MGLFKQMKQMREVVAEAPALIANAQQLQQAHLQQAQQAQMSAAQAGAANTATLPADQDGAADVIAGVSLELYARIARDLAARGGDQALAPVVAAEHGVDRSAWDTAVAGWNQRMVADPSVAQRFNLLWRGA